MSLAEHLEKKCLNNLQENFRLAIEKLSNPSSMVTFNVSGALVDRAMDGMGGLGTMAGDYLKNNADRLIVGAVGIVADRVPGVRDLLNTVQLMIATAVTAHNDLLLLFIKKIAQNAVSEIRTKRSRIEEVKEKLTILYNCLLSLNNGDPIYDEYLRRLRAGLIELNLAKTDFTIVANTLNATNFYLSRRFDSGMEHIDRAEELIQPLTKKPGETIITTIMSRQNSAGFASRNDFRDYRDDNNRGKPSLVFTRVNAGDFVVIEIDQDVLVQNLPDGFTQEGDALTVLRSPTLGAFSKVMVGDSFELIGGRNIVPGKFVIAEKRSAQEIALDKSIRTGPLSLIAGATFVIRGDRGASAGRYRIQEVRTDGTLTLEDPLGDDETLISYRIERDYEPPTQLTSRGLLTAVGVPNPEEQMANVLSIPRASKEVIEAFRGFNSATFKLNGLLFAFMSSLQSLQTVMPDVIKKYVLSLFNTLNQDLGTLIPDMANVLNGSETSIDRPRAGHSPEPVRVIAMAYKWVLQLKLISEYCKTIPQDALTSINVSNGAVLAYRRAVSALEAMDSITRNRATLHADNAQEEITSFQSQVLTFMLQANAAITSASISAEAMALGRTLIDRIDLSLERDREVETVLNTFIATPIPLEEQLQEILEGISRTLKEFGLDRAADLFESGDFESFFGLNGKTATYAGAALAACALLKQCFPTTEEEQEITKFENVVKSDMDLLNVSLSFNFDLAIMKNLEECLSLHGLADIFLNKELICGILGNLGGQYAADALNALSDMVSF